jgi:hypothetical protein
MNLKKAVETAEDAEYAEGTPLAQNASFTCWVRLAVRLTIAFRPLFPRTRIPRFTSTTVSRTKDRRLMAQTRSLGLAWISASLLPPPAPANPQNSNSGTLWYPLVPSGSLGGRERWPSAPFLRPRCGWPGLSVMKNEKLVKFGKVLVKFVSLCDQQTLEIRKPDRFWTDFDRFHHQTACKMPAKDNCNYLHYSVDERSAFC